VKLDFDVARRPRSTSDLPVFPLSYCWVLYHDTAVTEQHEQHGCRNEFSLILRRSLSTRLFVSPRLNFNSDKKKKLAHVHLKAKECWNNPICAMSLIWPMGGIFSMVVACYGFFRLAAGFDKLHTELVRAWRAPPTFGGNASQEG